MTKITVCYVGSSLLAPLRQAEREINRAHALGLRVAAHNFGASLADGEWEEVERDLAAALAAADGTAIFALTTQKGGRVLVPADKVAFIEFSTDQARRVGFGNIV